jgi:membrane-bound acyltransferase YfiQ involved in biofilm formation
MNEQLQSKLVEILSGIQAATRAAGDFAMEQLPDIAQQYVMYGRAVNTVAVIAALLVLLLLYLNRRPMLKAHEDDIAAWPVITVMLGCSFSFMTLLFCVPPALLVWFAPKVWLLKEIASLVK